MAKLSIVVVVLFAIGFCQANPAPKRGDLTTTPSQNNNVMTFYHDDENLTNVNANYYE